MNAAKSAGTASRWAATWRDWRQASQVRQHRAAATKTAKTKLKADALKAIWSNLRGRGPIGAATRSRILMAQDKTPLVWIDMEMSGLVPERERILEVAMVVTDADLEVIGVAPVYVVHQADELLEGMDSWNKSTHGKSGLVDKVRAS